MSRSIVFLDTSYQVNLTRSRGEGLDHPSDQAYFAQLNQILQAAAESGTFVTPAYRDQMTETSLGSRTFPDVLETARLISGGYRFCTDWDIIDEQILNAAKAFQGLETSLLPIEAVVKDPNFLETFATGDYTSPPWPEIHRSNKVRFAEQVRDYYSTIPNEFEHAREFLISCYIDNYLTSSRVRQAVTKMLSKDHVEQKFGWSVLVKLVKLWRNLEGVGVDISDDVVCSTVETLLERDPLSARLAWHCLVSQTQVCERLRGTPFDLAGC